MAIYAPLNEKDVLFFRETRENRFGKELEPASADRDTRVVAFRQSLEPMRVMLGAQPFFAGDTPNYADYIVFGCFQWARCISEFQLLTADDPVAAWRARLLGAFDGLGRGAPGYAEWKNSSVAAAAPGAPGTPPRATD